MTAEFQTYWLVSGERYDDYSEVEKLITEQNCTAVEVSAEQQCLKAEMKADALQKQAQFMGRTYREAVQRRYERSPEGQRQRALAEAAKHPGGIVTIAEAPSEATLELESFHRSRTNIFNR